jgi:Phage integrase, N-terminal SAM-like domain
MSIAGERPVAEFGLPAAGKRGHGSWYFDCAVPVLPCRCCRAGAAGSVLPGRRERLRRGGYLTRREAIAARDALLGDGETATAEGWTVQRWLRYWLTMRTRIRPTALRSYETHVEKHLIPHLGPFRLSELTGRHVTDMIAAIGATTNRYGRPPTPSTLHRVRATLRSALNAAIREGLLRDNPARYVEVPSPRRPHALVWTAQRVDGSEPLDHELAQAAVMVSASSSCPLVT